MNQLFLLAITAALAGCTLNCQNISTNGEATDLVDEEMATTPTVSPNISVTPK